MQNGSAKDKLLQDLLRDFTYICATQEIEMKVVHPMGKNNRIPDLLSRYHLHDRYKQAFNNLKEKEWEEVEMQKVCLIC